MKIINSPFVIALLVIIAAFILKSQSKPALASEIEGAYDALISIAEDLQTDTGKTKVVQDLSEQVALQIKNGLTSGFTSTTSGLTSADKENPSKLFLRVKNNIHVLDVKEVQGTWKDRQSMLFTIENKSDYPISQIRANVEFYRNNEIIDVKNEYLYDVKYLDTGAHFITKVERLIPHELSEEEKVNNTFDAVKITVSSFEISK